MRLTISCMRRLRVASSSVNVVVRAPEDFDSPVLVEVRLSSFDEDVDPYTVKLAWTREWTAEQRDDTTPFVDGLGAFAAAELALAALGGPCPETVKLLNDPPPDGYSDERRTLAFVVAAATSEAALTGERPSLNGEAVLDFTAEPA